MRLLTICDTWDKFARQHSGWDAESGTCCTSVGEYVLATSGSWPANGPSNNRNLRGNRKRASVWDCFCSASCTPQPDKGTVQMRSAHVVLGLNMGLYGTVTCGLVVEVCAQALDSLDLRGDSAVHKGLDKKKACRASLAALCLFQCTSHQCAARARRDANMC